MPVNDLRFKVHILEKPNMNKVVKKVKVLSVNTPVKSSVKNKVTT